MSQEPYLSVVVPSYNEQKNLQRGALKELMAYLSKQAYSYEIVLTDDGSTDGTLEELDKLAAKDSHVRVVANPHAGKGPTVQSGILSSKGQWRLFTDFDQSTPISEIEKLWPLAKAGAEVIIGSREIKGAKRQAEPWYRHLMGRGFNFLVQILAVPGIYDTQCGFKLFSAPAAQDLFSRLQIYGRHKTRTDAFTGAFDVEILFLARKLGYKIKEVPIAWRHFETNRVSPVKDSLRMLDDILKIRWVSLRGKYKI